MKEIPLVSIIVPVYNVEKYVGECIDSLLEQTYRNIEIVLIDDGSTDRSLSICESYAEKDPRIKVFHKENEGSGIARNFGVGQIRGEYFLFLDSDDWLRKDAIAKLYEKASQEKADIVYFDFVLYDQKTQEEIRSFENESYVGCADFVREKLKKCTLPSTCTSLYRTEKWRESGIVFPSCLYEDNEVYPKILIEFQNFCILPEGLYYYRINTRKSKTQHYENNHRRSDAIVCLMENVKNNKKYTTYYEYLYYFCYNQLLGALNLLRGNLGDGEFYVAAANFNKVLERYFPEYPRFESRYIYFGSYNIGRIGNKINSHDINRDRFIFSSVSALMNSEDKSADLFFENDYRKLMFEKEQSGALLKEIAEPYPKYLIFDLLEERFPLVSAEGQHFCTGEENILAYSFFGKILTWSDETTRMDIFKEACFRFADYCRKYEDRTKFIMVKLFLAEQYGTQEKKSLFPNAAEIRKINRILETCYEMIEAEMPDMIVCAPLEEMPELYFTDKNYRYGCKPEHLNNLIYERIGKKLFEKIVFNVKEKK